MNVTNTFEGLERYPVNVRYPRELRDNREQLQRVLIPTPSGAQIPLSAVAQLDLRRGPPTIKTEGSIPNAWIYVDITTSDVGGFVGLAKQKLADSVDTPAGYTVTWSGQFEYMERAAARLKVVIPITLGAVILLLYLNFRRLTQPLVVLLSIPFGLVGGIWIVHQLGFNLSVAVAAGFIALAGVAAEIGVLVVAFIDREIDRRRGDAVGNKLSTEQIREAVLAATASRVRPIVMTSATTIAGLIPIMWGEGTGSEVMQRIAAPMFGGMLSVMFLNLLVLPVVYCLILQAQERFRKPVEAGSSR